MTLKKYTSKRTFKSTPEPSGGQESSAHALRFVVQKHAARRLHYDVRLEYRGVLLSWAVPKGPSLDPKDKRLAVKVEDHPLDYQYFEGTIPKGNYGAGTVEIWDHGFYHAQETTSPQEIEKYLTAGLKKGHFVVTLSGEKLNGDFVFQKLKRNPEDNAWLLIKRDDAFLTSGDPAKNSHPKTKRTKRTKKNTQTAKMPDSVTPMLATLAAHPFNGEEWLFEIKWDGYRALAYIDRGDVTLKSRTQHRWNDKFPSIIASLKQVPGQVILDGELVVVDANGRSDFQRMQNFMTSGEGNLCYYVFDLLYKDGQDLREVPLIERKALLKALIEKLGSPLIRFSDHIRTKGERVFKEAVKRKLEGIIGKRVDSTYQPRRSSDWVKIKASLRQEVVIGGFTAPRGSRQQFGALLVGIYSATKELVYCGHVGGGFDAKLLKDIASKLKPLIRKTCPFAIAPKANENATWVKPELVCEVSFAEWTTDGNMRQPIFHGLRFDKPATAVKREVPMELTLKKKSGKSPDLELTHLDKIYWPKEKITKGDLLDYYENVAPYILPYLRNRPIVLHRYPNGIKSEDFYQKDLLTHPEWIKTIAIQHEGRSIHYLLIDDVDSLLYAVNLGSIDIHPCMSRNQNLENPDYCVIDLDPTNIPFEAVVEVALAVHEILDKIGVKHFCKTSGGKGLHLLIPLHGKYHFDQSRQFAQIIAYHVHARLPKTTSIERSPKKRPKHVYIDCLQNRQMQTIVAPYSVRPRPKAMVSTPLEWKEVAKGLDPSEFNIYSVLKRLNKIGDIFKPVLGAGINIKTALSRLTTS